MNTPPKEGIATIIAAYNKDCIGARDHERDIMLAVSFAEYPLIQDIFLTNEQAECLANDLKKQVEYNRSRE